MRIIERLADIPQGVQVYLFGCGQAGQHLKKILEHFRKDITLLSWIDSFKNEGIDGLRVIKPDALPKTIKQNEIVLIASVFWREIEKELIKQNIDNYLIIPYHFLRRQGFEALKGSKDDPLLNPLCCELRFSSHDLEIYKEPLEKSLSLFGYNEDKKLYLLLTNQISKEISPLTAITDYYYKTNINKEYLDFINFEQIYTIIEGGVFKGTITLEFLKRLPQNGMLYGFEPNWKDFQKSPLFPRLNKDPRVHIFPLGLWEKKTELGFKPDGAVSRIVEGSHSSCMLKINTISIDQFVRENNIKRIDFIKMDIEGAEPKALSGSINTLTKHRPQLAISIYHDKRHMFEIPILLNKFLKDYVYRLGHYSCEYAETILYAIPEEKCSQ
ncbi:FkbM family methyltransferase [bacterium]|nr:FkbM family methyltransferase [bacterium]